jgi:hypothetical protein
MKLSIAIAIVILAAAAGFAWREQQQLSSVREQHARLLAEAAALGISPDPSRPGERVITTKRAEREDKQAAAKDAAAKFIAFAKEMEQLQESSEPPGEAMRKRIVEMMDLMMSLDASQIKTLIAELRAAKDLKDETRQGLIGFAIMTLANDHPQAALALFTEAADDFKQGHVRQFIVPSALARWAKDDPMGALAWVRKHGEAHPDLVSDEAKAGLVKGVAVKDPKQALELISKLKLEDASTAIDVVASAAGTPEQRSDTLKALRDLAAKTGTTEKQRTELHKAVSELARSAAREGFATATQWIETAGFSEDELSRATQGFAYSIKRDETGQWIDWLGNKLPADKLANPVHDMIRNWTQADYQAAGQWLSKANEGPAKQAAVRSYAETVARYDPETAAQWGLTLPPGADREKTLKNIHSQWPKDDDASKAAAEAFARQHGIK